MYGGVLNTPFQDCRCRRANLLSGFYTFVRLTFSPKMSPK
jgi:hypothetical protein